MSITVIKGGISSGKTTLCMNMIKKLHSESKCIMLVNDKYSFEAEKSFIDKFGGTGLNNIEVMTFRKLSDCFVSRENSVYMTEAGKQMIIQRAINEYLSKEPPLSVNMLRAMKKEGFASVAASFLGEMGNYRSTGDDVREAVKDSKDKNFVDKMTVVADIYDIYSRMMSELNYTDENEYLDALASAIDEDEDFFKDTYVFVDAFNDFLLPRWNVIKSINRKAKQVYITLSVSKNETESEIYKINEATLDMIKDEYVIGEINAGEHLLHTKKSNPELYKLMNNWDNEVSFDEIPKHIELFRSLDMYMEVERVACKIVDLVREEGYRYRDISVVVPDCEEYAALVEPVFGEYDIPYFSDRKQMLHNHPITVQITALFDMLENNFDYESVFAYLKAGFIFREKNGTVFAVAPEEIDEIENYVLKYGIKGKTRWLKNEEFARETGFMQAAFADGKNAAFYEHNEKKAKFINSLRDELMAPVKMFDNKIRKATTGKDYVFALTDFFDAINIAEGIESEIVRLEKDGRIDESQQFEHIWALVIGVLDQLVVTMGDNEMSLDEFSQYIKTGISTCEIRLVPSGIDRVFFGSADDGSLFGTKVLFAMGAVEGTYPQRPSAHGFISDSEREFLNKNKKMFAETASEKMLRKNYSLFELFARVKDYIFISTYSYDTASNPVVESALIQKMKSKFPSVKESNNFAYDSSESKLYISTPKATLHKMLINKAKVNYTKNPLWEAVKEYYEADEKFSGKLHLLDGETEFFTSEDYIGEELSKKLYGDSMTYSKSKLDEYAKCPYKFFLNYGLGIKEREEWEISKADLGSYAHEIIERFCKAVENGAQAPEDKLSAWRNLDKNQRDAILTTIFDDVRTRISEADINQQEKTSHILGRMNKVISSAAEFITDCFVHGKYTIKGTELEISVPISDEVTITGFIDRIDELEKNGKKHLRIIDYKTGSSGFNIGDIYNGVNMQMPIYALAAKMYYKETENEEYDVSGMYYTKLRGELKTKETDVKSLRRLDGVTFADDAFEVLADMDDASGGDYTVMNAKMKRDGTPDKRSVGKVRTTEEGEMLLEYVKDKILEFDDNIRKKGDIRIMPYRGNCDFCDYQSLCSICEEIRSRDASEQAKGNEWESILNYKKGLNDEC